MAKEMGVIVTRYGPEKESWRQKYGRNKCRNVIYSFSSSNDWVLTSLPIPPGEGNQKSEQAGPFLLIIFLVPVPLSASTSKVIS